MADNRASLPGAGKARNSATATRSKERNAAPRMLCQKRSDLPFPAAGGCASQASGCMFELTAPSIIPRDFIERAIIEHASLVFCYNNLRVCERLQTCKCTLLVIRILFFCLRILHLFEHRLDLTPYVFRHFLLLLGRFDFTVEQQLALIIMRGQALL